MALGTEAVEQVVEIAAEFDRVGCVEGFCGDEVAVGLHVGEEGGEDVVFDIVRGGEFVEGDVKLGGLVEDVMEDHRDSGRRRGVSVDEVLEGQEVVGVGEEDGFKAAGATNVGANAKAGATKDKGKAKGGEAIDTD